MILLLLFFSFSFRLVRCMIDLFSFSSSSSFLFISISMFSKFRGWLGDFGRVFWTFSPVDVFANSRCALKFFFFNFRFGGSMVRWFWRIFFLWVWSLSWFKCEFYCWLVTLEWISISVEAMIGISDWIVEIRNLFWMRERLSSVCIECTNFDIFLNCNSCIEFICFYRN